MLAASAGVLRLGRALVGYAGALSVFAAVNAFGLGFAQSAFARRANRNGATYGS